ncbi:NAD-dependent epimerase/dehydratase family protein, partial [Streptomyces sp. NPDC002205]|uniref:NAD-dependent epimerase/dehydratase family protein n=1 Tax=Streptomyces sp. NPDC002205 TaxID=3154411 RepID=UPI0033268384
MKVAVIGGTGLIGSQVVKNLNAAGHEAVPHSQSTGVDVISGQGLDEAVAGADVVVNLTNSPTFDEASPAFFETSMDNLLAAAQKGKAVKLRADCRRQDVDAEGGRVGASVDLEALVRVSGQGSFHCAGADAEAAGGHELVQDGSADRSDEVDHGVGDDARSLDDLIAG